MAFRFANHCQRRYVGGVKPSTLHTAKRCASTTKVYNITNVDPPKTVTLKNGVRLASEASDGGLVSLSVFINAGSAHERPNKNGAANLLQTAAVQSASAQARKLGGELVGTTERERTTYSITCLPDKVPQAVALLGEVVASPASTDVIEKARAKVLAGRRRLWDVVNEAVMMDFVHSTAYQGTRLANTAEGEITTIKGLQAQDLEDFRTSNYIGSNIVVSAAGAVNSDQLQSATEAAFSGVTRASRPLSSRARYTGAMMHIRDTTVHDIQLAIGYETFSIDHPAAFTLGILKHLMGWWDEKSPVGPNSSSRLAETVTKEKLASYYRPFLNFYKDTGIFGVYARTTNIDHLDDLVYEIFNEYQKLYCYVSPEDIFRAKNALKAELLLKHGANVAVKPAFLVLPSQSLIEPCL